MKREGGGREGEGKRRTWEGKEGTSEREETEYEMMSKESTNCEGGYRKKERGREGGGKWTERYKNIYI